MEYCSTQKHDRAQKRKLEKVDEAQLRGILGAHPKIPLEALYIRNHVYTNSIHYKLAGESFTCTPYFRQMKVKFYQLSQAQEICELGKE